MAATVTVAMSPVPTDTLQECLNVAGISVAGATRFMEAPQIVNIEDMLLFCPSEAQELMNIYNRKQTCKTNNFGMAVQKKVPAFIYWICALQRRQDPIIYTF